MNKEQSELKISAKCSCGLITDFSDTIEPITVTGRPKTIIDANCIKCGKKIKLYVTMQNEKRQRHDRI